MKKFSKILSVALLVALVLSLGIANAFAAADTEHTITVKPLAGQKGTHVYSAYQVFAGLYDASKKNLSNITWGTGVDGDAVLEALKADTTHFQVPDTSEGHAENATVNAFKDASTAAAVAEILGTYATDGSDFAKAFSDVVGAKLTNAAGSATAQGSDSGTGNAAIKVKGDGYYFVKDTTLDENMPKGEARTDYILSVLADVEVYTKSSVTSSEKHVDDQNDSDANDNSTLKDSADYDIGDEVPYTISMTLPADFANYNKYEVVFYDDMSKGLTYKAGSAMIKYGDAAAVALEDPTNGTATYTDGHMYVWNLGDVRNNANLSAGKTITITYKAILNEFAVIGAAGNPNKMYVEFSNNPNGTGTGKTPDDINIAFTYKTVFNKVDAKDKKPLTGADFTLYKFVVSATGAATYNDVKGDWVNVTALHPGQDAKNPSKTISDYTKGNDTATNAKFTFSGLDAGVYKLEETTTPAGYNTIAPIVFTITAEHVLESDNPTLTSLTGANGAEFTMTRDTNNEDALTADVENGSGATLPSTGGIGTTIFYVVGGVLVLAAIILLVTKKRMSE